MTGVVGTIKCRGVIRVNGRIVKRLKKGDRIDVDAE